MMTINYDPELPFIFQIRGEVFARFRMEGDADVFRERVGSGEVINSTPKPKIPDDAEFVYYMSWANSPQYARRVGHSNNHVWETSNPTSQVSEEDLLIRIGDAEVTVLVRKEDS